MTNATPHMEAARPLIEKAKLARKLGLGFDVTVEGVEFVDLIATLAQALDEKDAMIKSLRRRYTIACAIAGVLLVAMSNL
jgi:hypothetical protein